MSIDGAHDGISPTRALETILGGKPAPGKNEGMAREKVLADVMGVADDYDDVLKIEGMKGYEAGCYWLAKQFLLLRQEGKSGDSWEMFNHMKDRCGDRRYDFTGFMVGYANNLSLWLLDKPPQKNPAILRIG